jgi:molybdopterin molybdotransferase
MIEFDRAIELVIENCPMPREKPVDLAQAVGHVLAESAVADMDVPPFSKSVVDGYAVVVDENNGQANRSFRAKILEQVTAGEIGSSSVNTETTVRIMTGAPVPEGANAIVMLEQTNVDNGFAEVNDRRLSAGQNILPRASIMAAGQTVVEAGTKIQPWQIGLLAEIGCVSPTVYALPTLAVLTTGNELVEASQQPGAGQIRNSNGPLLNSLAQDAVGNCNYLGQATDDCDELAAKIKFGLESDLLVISGGVSAGVLDLVPPVLEELGVQKVFHKTRSKPGKPTWFGVYETDGKKTLVFGLPGNPISSLVCFETFVKTAIRCIAGMVNPAPPLVQVTLIDHLTNRGDRTLLHPGRFYIEQQAVEPLPWKGSADQLTFGQANCLIRIEPKSVIEAGTLCDVLRLGL